MDFTKEDLEIVHYVQDAVIEGFLRIKEDYVNQIKALNHQIEELKQYSDVSLVKKLTVENTDLRSEITVLKRRLQQQPTVKPVQPPERDEIQSTQTGRQRVQEPQRSLRHEPERPERPERREPERPEPEPPVQRQEPEPDAQSQAGNDDMLMPVALASGNYFMDNRTAELFEFVDQDTPGDLIRKLKTVNIKSRICYVDGSDIYQRLDDGSVGDHIGKSVNGKAVLKK